MGIVCLYVFCSVRVCIHFFKTGKLCVVQLCDTSNESGNETGHIMHKFPKDPNLKICANLVERTAHSVICSIHSYSFFTRLFIREKLLGENGIQKAERENYFPVLCRQFSRQQQQQSSQARKRVIQTADSEGLEAPDKQRPKY